MRKAQEIILTENEKNILEKWVRSKKIPHRQVIRAQIIINASKGLSNKEISNKMEISKHYVGRWRSRFYKDRISGIEKDFPKAGRPPVITPELVKKIIDTTLCSKLEGETHWSTRSLAKKLGINHMIVYRVWKTHNIKPHLTRSFKFSKDPLFIEKLNDVVGLYMNPPEHAIVLSMDEKTQIQALERTQTILPIRPGLPEGRSHDYKRNGTVDLFAALNILNGKVITQFHDCHTRHEFLLFLKKIDKNTKKHLEIHMILDNLGTHKHPDVKEWLEKHPRFIFHFVPTGSSWLNAVENWFSRLTQKQIRRGSFPSVNALIKSIEEYTYSSNNNSKPFIWTQDSDELIRKIEKMKHLYDTAH